MAEEAILQVSLRDYKKSIDDLRASLLSLEEGSEEYAATAEEIRQRQDKLNEVMSVGKKEVDGVAGSYNALSQEMSKLKKEWKNMEMGTQAWEDMAVRINEMNDRLKEADASVGVFSRNVGDYANAFSQAFEKGIDGLTKIDGPLGSVMKTVKQLIPVVKTANSTAVKGLSGVKKAIVSTGVGALVVAVGLLVANWDKLMKVFRKGSKDTEKLIESNDTLNKEFDEQNRQLENEIIVMQADGASADEVNAKKQALIATQIAETRATIEETKAKIAQIGKHSLLGRILRGEQGEFKKLQGTLENLTATETGLVQQEERINANTYADRVRNRKNAANKEIEEVKRIQEEVKKASKTELQELDEKYKKEYALLKKHHKDTSKLTAQYNKDLAEIEAKQGRQKIDLKAEERSLQTMGAERLDSKYWKTTLENAKKNRDELIKYVNDNFQKLYDVNKEAIGRDLTDVEINNIYEILGFGSKVGYQKAIREAEIEIREATKQLNESLREEELANVRNSNIPYGTDSEIKNRLAVAEKELEQIKDAGKLAEETDDEYQGRIREQLENVIELKKELAEFSSSEKDFLLEWQKYRGINGLYSAAPPTYLDWEKLRDYEDVMQTYIDNMGAYAEDGTEIFKRAFEGIDKSTEEGYLKWQQTVIKMLDYFPEEARSHYLELLNNYKEAEKVVLDERKKNLFSFASSVANVYGSIADIIDESINHQKQKLIEQGKTEEEANELLKGKFKFVQAFQISQAVINTIAGALGAFMGITRDTGGWGIAAAVAEAAAVTAAGVAQIQKIANTKLGSGAGNVSSISANSMPKLMDYEPQKTQNITGASDEEKLQKVMESTNIWVSVKDINSVQNGVKARVSESSF